jgi:hypothetical protein
MNTFTVINGDILVTSTKYDSQLMFYPSCSLFTIQSADKLRSENDVFPDVFC